MYMHEKRKKMVLHIPDMFSLLLRYLNSTQRTKGTRESDFFQRRAHELVVQYQIALKNICMSNVIQIEEVVIRIINLHTYMYVYACNNNL